MTKGRPEVGTMQIAFGGKVAVITGGAMGIGAATAELFCELGASVAIVDINALAGERVVLQLAQAGYKPTFHCCDVSDEAQVEAVIDDIARQHRRVDILVSNAGIQRYGNVVSTSSQTWDETFEVHVKGCFYTTKYAIPHMLAGGGGAIVISASVQSFAAVANSAAYVAAKHALVGMTRSIALDFAGEKIRANCVCPGSIDTPLLRWAAGITASPEEATAAFGRMHALGRIGQPGEVAKAIAFLASDWASFITGTSLVVDGGLLVPAGGLGFQESSVEMRSV